MTKILRGGGKTSGLYLFLFCVAVLTGLLMTATFSYGDTLSLTAWSLNFWDMLFKGRLNEFYQYTSLNLRGAAHAECAGNYLWLLPLCIWNFPLWVVHSLAGILPIDNFFSLFWSKLFLLAMQYVTAYYSARICYMLTKDREKAALAVILILLSPETLMSVTYAGQDEIVYIGFFMAALYYYLQGYWKRCFWLMVCCVTICPIMAIPVLALLLLKEKNLYKVALACVIMALPLLLFEVMYRNDAIYQTVKEENGFATIAEGMLLTTKVTLSSNMISLCGILLCVIFFICYASREEADDAYKKKVIYIMAVVFGAVCFLMMTNRFYRLFLYVPFLVILIMVSAQNLGMNLLLFTAVTYGRTYYSLRAEYPQNMNTAYVMGNSWITGLCDLMGSDIYRPSSERYGICLWTRFNEYSSVYHVVVSTCAFAAMLLLLYINHPKYGKKHEIAIPNGLILTVCAMCMPIILAAFYAILLL